MNDKLRRFDIDVSPTIAQTVYAKSTEQAFAKVKESLSKHPIEIHEVADEEMEDVTPLPKDICDLLKKLKERIVWGETRMYPQMTEVAAENVEFADEELGDLLMYNELPQLVFADIVTNDEGSVTVYKGVEYDVAKLMKGMKIRKFKQKEK